VDKSSVASYFYNKACRTFHPYTNNPFISRTVLAYPTTDGIFWVSIHALSANYLPGSSTMSWSFSHDPSSNVVNE
jgi:hypothetical protein